MAEMVWKFAFLAGLLFVAIGLISALLRDRREDPKMKLLNSLITGAEDAALPSGKPILASGTGEDRLRVSGDRCATRHTR